jgi:hypothetical protein
MISLEGWCKLGRQESSSNSDIPGNKEHRTQGSRPFLKQFLTRAAALGELCRWNAEHGASNRSEATTRPHLIDKLLFEVLRWPVDGCQAEDNLANEYTDYSLGSLGKS